MNIVTVNGVEMLDVGYCATGNTLRADVRLAAVGNDDGLYNLAFDNLVNHFKTCPVCSAALDNSLPKWRR